MHSRNQWGGSFELISTSGEEVGSETTSRTAEWDRAALLRRNDLDETLQSWVLERPDSKGKKNKYVDFGCIVCSHRALKWIFGSVFVAFCVVGLPIIIAKSLPKHHSPPTPPDNYTLALHKALLFFNAQKCMYVPLPLPILFSSSNIQTCFMILSLPALFLFSFGYDLVLPLFSSS